MDEILSEKLANLKKRQRRYHLYHKEERNEKDRRWYEANKDKRRISKKKWADANRERLNALARIWYALHRDRKHDDVRKRRAKQKNVIGGHFTVKQFKELCDFYGNRCLCCGATDKKLTADHVIPLGPPHSDEISNIQPLCELCNKRKGTKTIDYRKH